MDVGTAVRIFYRGILEKSRVLSFYAKLKEEYVERYFTVSCNYRNYTVLGNERDTLDTVWASQKCWFMVGSAVTITDDAGNKKRFVKGVD